MKFKLYSIIGWGIFLLSYISLEGCPTCVGQVLKDSPLFFSDDFYQAYQHTDLVVDFITTITK